MIIVVFYDSDIKKDIKKGVLPGNVAELFKKTFDILDSTGDLNLFDIKQLTSNSDKVFYRLRKGKYRGIFVLEDDDIYVLAISKRDEVYRKWP
jgi:mRNA interferase RelE/StbE